MIILENHNLKMQKVKTKDLKSAKYNPRRKLEKNDEAYQRIKSSIEEFGYVDPMIVNANNMTVIGGHQRLEILIDLGYEEVECIMVNLDEKQEKRLNLALNKNVGYWDNSKLEELFDELNLSEEELFATGFSLTEVENLKTDFITELLDEDFSTVDRHLDKFAVTFNIPKEYEEQFSKYIKKNGKDYLVDILINTVEKEVI